jgi:HAD superfamily hydrolase (TIGR01549 family)
MHLPIDAILFDMGGTLCRTIRIDWDEGKGSAQKILELLGVDDTPEEFVRLLATRATAYRQWARETERELNEGDLWTQWMLPDLSAELIRQLAVQLNQLWRDVWSRKVLIPEAQEVILTLFRRGYRLGLVSNTVSSVEAPQALKEMGVRGCFEAVLLSCTSGTRKPDPSMLLEAAAQMGIEPKWCAYVGDRPDRDVAAARRAGFAQTMIYCDPSDPAYNQVHASALSPDHFINNLKDLLDFYPSRPPKVGPSAKASLSTMWARKNFPSLGDFLLAARRLGFAQVELNHEINSEMLAGIDLKACAISSLHEPCPADISTGELKRNDWLISSDDEPKRVRGVESIQRSIDLASQIGARIVVVHAGQITGDLTMEKQLRLLVEAGQGPGEEATVLRAKMTRFRQESIAPHFQAVKKSLQELLEYAAQREVRLGLENRFHYTDLPTPDEMEILLGMAEPGQLGMVFDTGHAQVLDRLGFFTSEEWIDRFASRMLAVHLHDVNCLTDHAVPGTGEVNFLRLMAALPNDTLMTFEIQDIHSGDQIRAGLQWMMRNGWVRTA